MHSLPIRLLFFSPMASHLYSFLTFLFVFFIAVEKVKSDKYSDDSHQPISDFDLSNFIEMFSSTANDSARPLPGEFSHYTLSLRWPPSFCRPQNVVLCNTPFPENFVIYGLWPTDNNGGYPLYCASQDNAELPYSNTANLDLWTRHGSCSGLTQLQYFKTSVDLLRKLDLLQRLNSLGYHSSPNVKYDPGMIISQYKDKYGVGIRIICGLNSAGQEMLTEIHLKVNKDGETLESISGPSNLCQTTEVAFP